MDFVDARGLKRESGRVSLTPAGDAVVISNAEKSYRKRQPVLQGLNMTVPCGSIYGLLGSSGCGKTTVLNCLVGIRELDKGQIWIFGEKPGNKIGIPGRNVGYMPQEISLFREFTIGESLNYFGTLSGMTSDEIRGAKDFLLRLLDLRDDTRRIENLSGGQQRRVSLVAALLGEPELLILDEPTVGVDPVIRQKIWLYLRQLAESKRTTVIVTTHYIEECRSADNIGIMRNGRLLEECPPSQLMQEYNSNNLEAIVLNLSRQDKARSSELSPLSYAEICEKPPRMASLHREPDTGIKIGLCRIKALTGKNFVVLFRNPLLLFFNVLIAAAMLIIICVALGSDPKGLHFGVINKEGRSCPNYTTAEGECRVEMLSCQYLNSLKEGVLKLKIFDGEEAAVDAVELGSSWGHVIFPDNFSAKFYERIADGREVDEGTLYASQIIVKLDESNKQITEAIKRTLYDGFQDFMSDFLSDCSYNKRQGEYALKYEKPLFGSDTTDFREFLAPGQAISIIFFFPILTTSVRYIGEKKSGVLHRSIVSGVKTWEILFAYSITELCVLLIQSILSFLVINILFKIEVMGSIYLVMGIILLSGYSGVAVGFLLGAVCSEEITAALAGMAAFLPIILLSGIVWPLEGMWLPLQYFAPILPCTMAAEGVRSVISRGWEFSHPNVWPGFAITIAYIFVYFILTILFHVNRT